MKLFPLLYLFFLLPFSLLAHKDRGSRPIKYEFQFVSGNPKQLDAISDFQELLRLNTYYFDNLSNLKSVKITFKGDTEITFKYSSGKLDSLILKTDTLKLSVPKIKLDQFKGIHFTSLVLGWNGSYSKISKSSYQFIAMNHGNRKFFDKFQRSQILFRDGSFKSIWTKDQDHRRFWESMDLD